MENSLRLLSYARRLELLLRLQTPLTMDEMRLQPGKHRSSDNPGRPIARQSIQHHLSQLVNAGLVQERLTKRKGRRPVKEFVVDHAKLFAIIEDLRKVSTVPGNSGVDTLETMAEIRPKTQAWPDGPKVVIAHGVHEGKVFTLRPTQRPSGRGWVIGRARKAAVCLDYDPFVSRENAEILQVAGGFRLLDLRTSRNGTGLNWRNLPAGGEVPLENGDLIVVGRSLLLFRAI